MRYLSVCSGIEAASAAWHSLGWSPVGFSEIERFPSAVLAHHYPSVPNLGDMTRYREWDLADIDLLVGGTPCQSFSVAGLRAGMDDPRGNLALTFLGLVDRLRPRWVVWENVPGVLSSSGGRDFGAFLGGLGQLGYGWAYRVLDAQYIRVDTHARAVPQRRRRVFVVGHSGGDWHRAAAVLFERESLSGNFAPRREAGKGAAPILEVGARTGSSTDDPRAGVGIGTDADPMFTLQAGKQHGVAVDAPNSGVASTLFASGAGTERPAGTASETGFLVADTLRQHPCPGINTVAPIVFDPTQITSRTNQSNPPVVFGWQNSAAQGLSDSEEVSPILDKSKVPAVAHGVDGASGTLRANPGSGFRSDGSAVEAVISVRTAVRRLTPTECERLQGFPDGYTDVPYRGKTAADGPRYKALGNSMAVNVMRWIGLRIQMVEGVL